MVVAAMLLLVCVCEGEQWGWVMGKCVLNMGGEQPTDSLTIGTHVLNILELVRKYKSTKELSLRSEIDEIHFSGKEIAPLALLDLKNACNSKEMKYLKNIEQPDLRSNCGKYSILVL